MIKLLPFAAALALLGSLASSACADASRNAVAAPAGTVVLKVHAVGAQVYDCTPDGHGGLAWSLREPIATLMHDGRTVGRHFAGPTWEMADGSRITGKVVDKAAGDTPDDIPWLKLAVTGRYGAGDLADVAVVQRLATAGGAKSGPCQAQGSVAAVPYAADYVFSK